MTAAMIIFLHNLTDTTLQGQENGGGTRGDSARLPDVRTAPPRAAVVAPLVSSAWTTPPSRPLRSRKGADPSERCPALLPRPRVAEWSWNQCPECPWNRWPNGRAIRKLGPIDLDGTRRALASRPHPGSAQPVQHRPVQAGLCWSARARRRSGWNFLGTRSPHGRRHPS